MTVRIIGIGASAGGLQALELFFSELPSDLGVAFVVVQHLSMDHVSSLAEILQRATTLKVEALTRHTIPRANYVYVKMPEVEVYVEAQSLRVEPRQVPPRNLYLPIDDFFQSLAWSRKEDAIAIVLSGMGTDGSRGLKEIKSQGGLIMVQEPESAQFDGMPRAALRHNLADVVLAPKKLATQLTMILRNTLEERPDISADLNHDELLSELFARIRKSVRIDFTKYRPATILRRIEKRMLIRHEQSMSDYLAEALRDEREMQLLQRSFLIGVTRFFRDEDAFRVLREEIVPGLFETSPEEEVRIWVPACSTGEEVYSIAIIISEYLDSINSDRGYRIFGSDVDRNAILTAATGVFDETALADIPSEYVSKYFVRKGQSLQARLDLREHLLFAVQDLIADPPFIRIDFISCRNFLIYITTESQQQVLSNFHFSLTPNGYLLLGPSESLGQLQTAFSTVDRRWKVYQKRNGARTPSGHTITPNVERYARARHGVRIIGERPEVRDLSAAVEPPYSLDSPMDFYARFLSEKHAPATLFVNQQYDILYLHGELAAILHLPRYHAHLSLQTAVAEEAKTLLISGVDRALATGTLGTYERINVAPVGQPPFLFKVHFRAHQFDELKEPVVLLNFYPLPEGNGQPEETAQPEIYSVDNRLNDRIRELEGELLRSEQRAQKLYNELEATNEELQSSNRELLASNEEMQSTNEELQSVNEELYTVNHEFQRKNEELNLINNDFSNLLKSTQISTIFVDSELKIRNFNPGIGQQFDLNSNDVGRSISAFSNPFEGIDIPEMCLQVMNGGGRFDEEVQDQNGDYYLLRVRPYLTEQDEVKGAVVTFVDINDLVRTRRRLVGMATKYEAIFNNTQEVIVICSESGRIGDLNRSLAGRAEEELMGTYFADLIREDFDKVKFGTALRTARDEGSAVSESIVLAMKDNGTLYASIEILPISEDVDSNEAGSIMIILRDITTIQIERREARGIIQKYQEILKVLRQDAGLLDMNEVIVLANDMPSFNRDIDTYEGTELAEFLTEAGLSRYRDAADRLKQGSSVEEVNYPAEELIHDEVGIKVLYRPIYGSKGNLAFINFEVITSTPPSSD